MKEGFWSARLGGVTVCEWSLEEAVHSLFRVKRYSLAFKQGRKP